MQVPHTAFLACITLACKYIPKRNSGMVVSVFINQAGTALGTATELMATIFEILCR